MNKFLILLALSTLMTSSFAQQGASAPVKEITFAQKKALALQALEGREKIMAQEKICANNSQNIEQLKSCFTEANENRKVMVNELKAKRDQMKK